MTNIFIETTGPPLPLGLESVTAPGSVCRQLVERGLPRRACLSLSPQQGARACARVCVRALHPSTYRTFVYLCPALVRGWVPTGNGPS